MKKNVGKWRKGRRTITSLILATTILLSSAPEVYAEDNELSSDAQKNIQMLSEKTITPNIIRYEGRSRENVAEAVARDQFSHSNKVILVNRDKFPDAISATNISQGEYPVLYTRTNRVSDSTIELLKTMSLDEIYILGGELSINKEVVDQLQQTTNVKVTRIAGRSRYDANVSAVRENFTQKHHVVIASGEVYSDALYGVSYANTIDAPVILTKTNQLESSTIELLKDLGVQRATIIGGTLTVTEAVENQLNQLNIHHERIAGRNRYIGSAEVANASYNNPENVVIASGEVFSDALVSAPLAQKLNAPILLVRKNRVENIVKDYLINNLDSLKNTYIQGGSLTISERLVDQLFDESSKHDPVIKTETVTKTETIAFGEDREYSVFLEGGEEKVLREGREGEQEVVYEQVFKDGVLVETREISRVTIRQPINKQVQYGLEFTINNQLFAQEMLVLVNNLRESVGVSALKYDDTLQTGTDIRAQEIIETFDHTRPDGRHLITAFGYEEPNRYLGENIASNYGQASWVEDTSRTFESYMAELFFDQWKASEGHYKNMIDEGYVTFATSTAKSGKMEFKSVQIFGTSNR